MISLFVQTSDIHTGDSTFAPNYLERHKGVMQQITDEAKKVGRLVIAGDIFHINTKPIKNDERHLIDWWFGDLEKNGIDTVVISGNHDHLYGDVTHLTGYTQMPFKHVRIFSWYSGFCEFDGIGFICIPWNGYSEEGMREEVLKYEDQAKKCEKVVVVAHECIIGSKFDNGILSERGTKLPHVDFVDYWAIGDIHERQNGNLDNSAYSGAPLQFKFGDRLNKGFLVVQDDFSAKFKKTKFVKFKTVNKLSDIKDDDSLYKMVGNMEDVLEANKREGVVSSEWKRPEAKALNFDHQVKVTDGLIEFLATKGCDQDLQKQGLEFVQGVLNAC